MSDRTCIISDLHLGCHSDSEHWHQIILDWGAWLKSELIDKNVENIIMCGDFFDNRNEIGVKTISVAGELMDLWRDFKITMIAGNHDLFYKNRTDINSISIFDGYENVDIISELTEDSLGDTKVTYIPWGSDISKCRKTDIIFGHLEINGFRLMVGKVAEGKIPPKSLTSKAKLIFSGHYHLRDERKYTKSKIIYVGSPYQINWGESSNIPGYYLLNTDDLTYEFFENTISPKHIKMTSKTLKLDNIEGNIVAIDMDQSLDDADLEKIKHKIYEKSPLEIKFNILRDDLSASDIEYVDNMDMFDVMMDFVDKMDLDDYVDEIKETLKELYDAHVR